MRIAVVLVLAALLAAVLLAMPSVRHPLVRLLPPTWKIRAESLVRGISVDHGVRIVMPDGVRLAATLYLPKEASRPLATVLVRAPYGRNAYGEAYDSGLFFARQGYAVLVQDLRGTGDSGGELLPWRDVSSDGAATLDWIAAQSWSNGKVGTFGCSALGETQLVLAPRQHPAHAAMISSGSGGAVGSLRGRHGYFGLFEGGVFQLASGFGWFVQFGAKDPRAPAAVPFDTLAQLRKLPVATLMQDVRPAPNGYTDFLDAPPGDPRWREWGYLTDHDLVTTPTFLINTWGDQTVADSLAFAEFQRLNAPAHEQKVVIAPGVHCQHEKFGLPDRFGAAGDVQGEAYRQAYLRWFDHWLRGEGEGLAGIAPYTFYMLGEDRWYESDRWPPAASKVEQWFLDSGGNANTRDGDGVLTLTAPRAEATDTLVYDPDDPVPTRGGPVCCTGDDRDVSGPADQADVESRPDVLVYTSAPLEQDLRIAGPLSLRLNVSSDTPDTDLVARLVDVAPDGLALNIQEGALRLRYRDGPPGRLMEPGERYTVTVDLRAIAYRISKGHRLRLQVTSSSFPRLERNLNGGGDVHRETVARIATNRIHHGPDAPAWLSLPVLSPDP
jgi:putative CocE/NonD family hydrolase